MQMSELLEKVLGSPVGRQIIEADAGEKLAKRRDLIARIKSLTEEEARVRPPLQKAEDEARGRFQAAQKAVEAAGQKLNEAISARSSAASRFNSDIARIEQELRNTCDPAVLDFISEMEALGERERHTPTSSDRVWDDKRRAYRVESSYPALCRRLQAIREARAEAYDHVVLEVHDTPSLQTRLQKLRDGLPAVEIEELN